MKIDIRKVLLSTVFAGVAAYPVGAAAQEPSSTALTANSNSGTAASSQDVLETVVVTGIRASDLTSLSSDPYPANSISRDGLTIFGGPAGASSMKALAFIPGVIADAADPYGLSNTQTLNIRGKSDFFAAQTIDGLQVAGIVGGVQLVDLEDVNRIDVYAGALRADQGLASSNASGVVDQILRAPLETMGATANAGYGSYNFQRIFGRVDSGRLSTGTAVFVSASDGSSDQWKGPGDAKRVNVTAGVSQTIGSLDITLFGAHNSQQANLYPSLTFAQLTNLGANYNVRYNGHLTGVPTKDVNYYDYNRQSYNTNFGIGEATYHIDADQQLIVKSSYWGNDGTRLSASGTGIQLWPQNNTNYGVITEYHGQFGNADATAGYWYQSLSPDPPPVKQKQFNIAKTTGALTFASWKTLGTFGRTNLSSPFFQLSEDFGSTYVTGGLRYVAEATPSMTYYKTTGLPNVSYEKVFSFHPAIDPLGQVDIHNYHIWLPNIAVKQQITSEFSVTAGYSEKMARIDWGPQASSFFAAEAAFTKAGIDLNKLQGDLVPEHDQAIDIRPRLDAGPWTVSADFFGYKAHNKEVLVFNPIVGQSYYQSNVSTTGDGLETTLSYKANDNLFLFANNTIQHETYDSDIALTKTTINAIKGKQAPNAPELMTKLGFTYVENGFSVTGLLRDIGARYGLANDTQKVKGYDVVDLYASYDLSHVGINGFLATLSIQNLFNEQYVGGISVNEDNLNSTAYTPGAPQSMVVGLSASF